MFARYDYTDYPIVNVYFSNTIRDLEDFQLFLSEWVLLYNRNIPFTFIFHTEEVGYIPLKYSFMMSSFIKNLKKRNIQYLEKSIIFVSSSKVDYLLSVIFYLQRPVAPVYIINTNIVDKQVIKTKVYNNVSLDKRDGTLIKTM